MHSCARTIPNYVIEKVFGNPICAQAHNAGICMRFACYTPRLMLVPSCHPIFFCLMLGAIDQRSVFANARAPEVEAAVTNLSHLLLLVVTAVVWHLA